MKPVSASSCAIAGTPSRVVSITYFWNAFSARAPSRGATGRLPKGRVTWPMP